MKSRATPQYRRACVQVMPTSCHCHITSAEVYCRGCSVAVTVANLLMGLIYKLNFVIAKYVGRNMVHTGWYYPWFQASTKGLDPRPPQIQGDYCLSLQPRSQNSAQPFCYQSFTFSITSLSSPALSIELACPKLIFAQVTSCGDCAMIFT